MHIWFYKAPNCILLLSVFINLCFDQSWYYVSYSFYFYIKLNSGIKRIRFTKAIKTNLYVVGQKYGLGSHNKYLIYKKRKLKFAKAWDLYETSANK